MIKEHIYQRVKNYLLYLIAMNHENMHYMLPSEKQLSHRFECSALPVKRALSELVAEGKIYRIQGRGSFILHEKMPVENYERKSVCLLVPNIESHFIRDIIYGTQDYFNQTDMNLFINFTQNTQEIERKMIDNAIGRLMDGLIIFPFVYDKHNLTLMNLMMKNYPITFVARKSPHNNFGSVFCDNYLLIENAINYLKQQGHREIAFISEPAAFSLDYGERVNAYRKSVKEKPSGALHLCEVDFFTDTDSEKSDQNFEIIARFFSLNKAITALIITNQVLRYLDKSVAASGISAKTVQLMVIDMPEEKLSTSFLDPIIIYQHPRKMGYQAAQTIYNLIIKKAPPEQVVVDSELIPWS